MIIANIADFREAAQRRLPHFLFEYIDGGSYAEATLARNVSDLAALALRQRILVDVADIDLSAELFGQKLAMPVALAPIGLAGMNARRGEVQALRAAEAAGVPFTLSTVSVCPLREVAAAATKPFWFQLYMIQDRGFMRELLAQAREAQCPALVFTVDMAVPGSRYRDVRSGLAGAAGPLGRWERRSRRRVAAYVAVPSAERPHEHPVPGTGVGSDLCGTRPGPGTGRPGPGAHRRGRPALQRRGPDAGCPLARPLATPAARPGPPPGRDDR